MSDYNDKKYALLSYIDDLTREDVVLAFSGGVDSSLLLKLCCEAARRKNQQVKLYAVTLHTKLHPPADLKIARQVALETGADEHIVLYVDELAEAGIGSNPVDRCYMIISSGSRWIKKTCHHSSKRATAYYIKCQNMDSTMLPWIWPDSGPEAWISGSAVPKALDKPKAAISLYRRHGDIIPNPFY